MPILRCPECEAVIAWRGKSLAVPCPNDHGREVWSGNGWRDETRLLHVDRDGIERNGHAIDAHLGGPGERRTDDYDERLARWAAALAE